MQHHDTRSVTGISLALGISTALGFGLMGCSDGELQGHAEDDSGVPRTMRSDASVDADAGFTTSPDASTPDVDAGAPSSDAGRPEATCDAFDLCDGFEDASVGATTAPGWSVATPHCSGTSNTEIVDDIVRTGSRALRVRGDAGYCNHIFLQHGAVNTIDGAFYVRFFIRSDATIGEGHITFLTFTDAVTGRDLRMGGQARVLMWNRESDDATLPALSPAGTAMSDDWANDTWTCIEAHIDPSTSRESLLSTWVDGELVPGLVIDNDPTLEVDEAWLRPGQWHADLSNLRLGWESYSGEAQTLWFDDVAVSRERIGCD